MNYKGLGRFLLALFAAIVTLLPVAVSAAEGPPHLDGSQLSPIWVLPFAGMLLCIAIFPLVAPRFWHDNFGKASAFWFLTLFAPFTVVFGWKIALYEALHTLLGEYIPFIILLFSLFTVAGGIRLKGSLVGTPGLNTLILFMGTVIASLMGTTGAAMLLIRPLLRANEGRKYRVHSVVFFIFLVANIGGSLSPLGDPPLFLGFLKGVSFFWPTTHLFLPALLVSSLLLALYYGVDSILYRKEDLPQEQTAPKEKEPLSLEGKGNFLLLLAVVGGVLLSGFWRPNVAFEVYHVHVELQNIVRDLLLVGIAILSLKITSGESRRINGFNWFPIVEVAKLFIGIFATIIPVIAILKAGKDGALSAVIQSVSTESGEPVNMMYFWATGILSSFLDNAPTYLVFFNTAGGDAEVMMGPLSQTLLAISAGAVFMGANTYIGNAPNFMIRSIAEESGVPMPSFFGYMIWSCAILIPVFVIASLIFFT